MFHLQSCRVIFKLLGVHAVNDYKWMQHVNAISLYNMQPYAITDIGHWILGLMLFYFYALC